MSGRRGTPLEAFESLPDCRRLASAEFAERAAAAAVHPDWRVRLVLIENLPSEALSDPVVVEALAWAVTDARDEVAEAAARRLSGTTHGTGVAEPLRALIASSSSGDEPRLRALARWVEPASNLHVKGWGDPATPPALPGASSRLDGPPPEVIMASPVTVSQFTAYLEEASDRGGIDVHPGAPLGTSYDDEAMIVIDEARAGRLDPDGPMVGVSWFDAWAFAVFHGCRLPTVAQLTRGLPTVRDERTGESNDRSDGQGSPHLPASSPEPWQAPVLEWTRERYLDEGELQPFIGNRYPVDTIDDWTVYATVVQLRSESDEPSATLAPKHACQAGPNVGFRLVADELPAAAFASTTAEHSSQ